MVRVLCSLYVVYSFHASLVGTGVGVVGAVSAVNGTTSPVSTYTLDDASPVTYTAPTNATDTLYSQTFFLQQSLSASEHTLVINVTHASDAAPFLFDYIGYIPLSSATSSSSLSMTSGTSSAPAQITSSESTSSKSSTPVGAIVGGTIGGVALLVMTIFGALFLRSRRSRPSYYQARRQGKSNPIFVVSHPMTVSWRQRNTAKPASSRLGGIPLQRYSGSCILRDSFDS